MHRPRSAVLGFLLPVLLLGLGVWWLWPGRAENKAEAAPPLPTVVPALKGPTAGTDSCAARGCHGGMAPSVHNERFLLTEYTTWATQDPHRQAYAVLLQPRSELIANRLGLGPAHEAARCLVCHATPETALLPDNAEVATLVRYQRRAGVGCEACHGNALDWLDRHVATDWREQDKQQVGFVALDQLETQIRRCAGCHVGAPASSTVPLARDVNHDLLAAGHPRLTFEFSSFLANLPRHWKPKAVAVSEVDKWLRGQAVTADCALELLGARAATPSAPWPELAEYDCFACHHALAGQASWRTAQVPRGGRRDALPWGTWYFAMPRALGGERLPTLALLTDALEARRPNRAAVRQHIEDVRAAKTLDRLLDSMNNAVPFARSTMDRLVANERPEAEASWDSAEQTYLALAALNTTARDPRYQRALAALENERALQPGWDGPQSLGAAVFVPPEFFAKLREHLRK